MARIAPSVLLTLAGALPGVALAGSPLDKVLAGADSVELSGPIDVPLYSAPWGGSSVGVFANVGEERVFLRVMPGTSSIYLSAAAAGKLGTKVKTKEVNTTEYNYTDLDEMKVGDVVLRDVRVLTTELEIDSLSDIVQEETPEGVGFDGHIGLGILTEHLSWALLRDAGVLRLAPAKEGASLVSGLGGKTLKTRSVASKRLKFGKEKAWSIPEALIAKVDIGGNEVEAYLSWWTYGSVLDSSKPLPQDAPARVRGDSTRTWVSAGIDGAMNNTWVDSTSTFSYLTTDEGRLLSYDGVLGRDILEELDVAFDPVTGDLGYKHAENPTYKDPLPEMLADAQAAVDESLKPAEDAAADAEAPKGDKGAWKRLAEVKEDMGDFDGAIDALTKITELDEDACDPWQDLGIRQWTAGDLAGAQASLQKSADLFNAWWSPDIALSPKFQKLTEREIELENRKHLAAKSRGEWSELIAKAEKKEIEPAELGVPEGLKPQAGSACRSVNSDLAMVLLAKGETDRVSELYAERADWDRLLHLVAGNAALADADLDAAQAAYRQNAKMNLSHSTHSRIGLALVLAKEGRWDDAKKLWAQANESNYEIYDSSAWLMVRGEKDGAVAAAKEAAQMSDAAPGWAAGAVLWAEWAKAAGDEARVAAATKRAKEGTAGTLRHDPDNAFAIAMNARLALVTGDTAAARKGAERAIQLAPGSTFSHEALAMVQAAEGDQAKADATMKKAAGLAPNVPFYAMQLGKK